MEIPLENLTSIILAIVGIVSLGLTFYFNRKTLQQSEKNLKIQLFYEDKKKAIFELNKILRFSDNLSTKSSLIHFLESPESQYLPLDTKSSVLTYIKEIEGFMKEGGYDKTLEENQPFIPEEEKLRMMEEEMIRLQDPEEWVNDQLQEKITSIKAKIKEESEKKLKDLED